MYNVRDYDIYMSTEDVGRIAPILPLYVLVVTNWQASMGVDDDKTNTNLFKRVSRSI